MLGPMMRTLVVGLMGLSLLALACGEDEAATGNGRGGSAGTSSVGGAPDGGAGTGAASSSGGGGSAGSGGSGGSADPCLDRLLCDDFEGHTSGQEPGAPWTVLTSNTGSVAVDQTRAFSGSQSVKVMTDGTNGFTRALISASGMPAFPLPNNVMHGRMMFYLEQAANDGVHWTHIEGRGALPGQNGVSAMYRYGGQHNQRLMANYETGGLSTDCWHHSQTTIPTQAWACMEWMFDGPNDRMRLWIDGTEISDLDVMGSGMGCIGNDLGGQWPAPDFEEIRVGWESYQNDAPREAWIDDVIIDDEAIGCP
jgi:hypothetical protein